MKNLLRLVVLVGVISLSWFATERPVHAIVDCSAREGACTQQGASGYCFYWDDGMQCSWIYPCWCDRAFGPLQWRCGPNPVGGSCY